MAGVTVPAGAPEAALATGEVPEVATAPWRVAGRALGTSWTGRISIFVVLFIILSSLAAPLWADHVAHTGPFNAHVVDTIELGGKQVNVVSYQGAPIGPTWHGRFFLGASDSQGRDEMVRLLYGGRNSLLIGFVATFITMIIGTILAMLAGYYRGWTDSVISRGLDVLWSTPVILLGIALGVATALGGLSIGPIHVSGDSLLLPALIIGVINVVYIARPMRGIVLSLRERQFVEAARSQGAGNGRIIFREILPNLSTSLLVLGPIMIAQTVALEAALSFLGAGVQPPNPSWGTMLSDGIDQLITAPQLTVIPGAVLASFVLALNLIGDIVREALDPRGVLSTPGKADQ